MAVKKTSRSSQSCNYGSDCPEGQWCSSGTCVPYAKKPGPLSSPSAKAAASVIGSGLAAMGTYLKATGDKASKKRAVKKQVDSAIKTVTNKVMKKGGMVKKRVVAKKK